RKSAGADHDTGLITQCYRVAGTPNFPGKAKRKRGRVLVERTKILEQSETSFEEALAAFADVDDGNDAAAETDTSHAGDEAELPSDLMQLIRDGVDVGQDRSAAFHSVVARLKKRRWSAEAIANLLERYPDGIASKYIGRLGEEVERSYGKHAVSGEAKKAGQGKSASAGSVVTPRTLTTIRVVAGELPRIVSETEQ